MRSTFVLVVLVGFLCNVHNSHAQSKTVTKAGAVGCISKDYFEKIVNYSRQGDKEASKRAMTAGILSGECAFLTDGGTVYIEDTAAFSGLVKLRQKGETVAYWTFADTVTK